MSKVVFTEEGSKPPAPSAGQVSMYVKTDEVVYIQDSAGIETALGTSSGITSLTGEATGTGPGAATVTLSNAAVIAKVLTGFVTGPNSTVVASDSILAAIQKLQAQVGGTAGSAITALTGDVTAIGPGSAAATVNSVGGLSAALVAAGSTLANAATSANTGNDIVRRDNIGNFSASTITANLIGNASTSTNAINFTGSLAGDVGGTQGATVLATVNSNTGSFGSSTSIPSFTVNAKGLITAASGSAVVAPAGTLTGGTLASNVLSSSLTSVGTLNNLFVTGSVGINTLSPVATRFCLWNEEPSNG